MKIRSWIPISVDIGEDEPLALKIRKKVTQEEGAALRSQWRTVLNTAPGPEQNAHWNAILVESFRNFVRFASPTSIEFEDGTESPLASSEELVAVLGLHPTALDEIFLAILRQAGMTPEEKKVWLRLIGSMRFSDELEKEAPGPKPETTAESVEGSVSASNGDAPAPQESTPSGSTDEEKTESPSSSSTNVQFSH